MKWGSVQQFHWPAAVSPETVVLTLCFTKVLWCLRLTLPKSWWTALYPPFRRGCTLFSVLLQRPVWLRDILSLRAQTRTRAVPGGGLRRHPARCGVGSVYPEYRYSKTSPDWVLFKNYLWRAGERKRTSKKNAEWMSRYQELSLKPSLWSTGAHGVLQNRCTDFVVSILWWCLISEQGPLTRTPFL